MSDSVRTRRERQAAETRAEILEAARQLFGERGYRATAIEDITKAVGAARGALYHHFPSKQALFRTVVEAVEAESGARVLTATHAEGTAWSRLEAGCQVFLDVFLDRGTQQILLIDAPSVLEWGPGQQAQFMTFVRSGLDGLFGGQRNPELDTESLAHALFGTLNALALFIANSQDGEAARARAGQTLSHVIRGLAGEPTP